MSRYLEYVFPAGVENDVCLLQNIAGAGNLILNGNLADPITQQVNFILKGYCRSISISSANDLSGVNFTINGVQNGKLLSRVVAGPNNEIIYFGDTYDIITSISVDNAVNGVLVGTGYLGFFRIIPVNLERNVINYSLSLGSVVAVDIPITGLAVYGTLSKDISDSTYIELVTDDNTVFTIQQNIEEYQYIHVDTTPYYYLIVQITGSADGISNTTQLNFIQI